MPITIDRVRIRNQNGDSSVFTPHFDALTFILDISVTQDILDRPYPRFTAQFQVLHLATNRIVVDEYYSQTFRWGTNFWISMGNNWSQPYTTAAEWGLNPAHWPNNGGTKYSEIWGFRGIIRVDHNNLSSTTITGREFYVSEIKYFRVRPAFYL